MRYWWVNQNQTFRQEQSGGYLWSPKRKTNRSRNHFYDTMREVRPGDLVLSFRDQRICSIGVARSYCYESPKPVEFGTAGASWDAIGWRVDVQWHSLINQIKPADHIDVLRRTLPAKYSPIRAVNGRGLQSVYLTEIPIGMMEALAGLIGYEVRVFLDAPVDPLAELVADRPGVANSLKETWERHLETEIQENPTINDTERVALTRARKGQGIFRENVRRIERCCRVTRVENAEHLIASHCKPWRHSTNEQRLDGENGLLLTPTIDHLFDRGFISFEDSGRLVVSPVADDVSLKRMGLDPSAAMNVGGFTSGQKSYLDYHRDEILLQIR